MAATPVKSSPLIPEGQYKVAEVNELNNFDLTGERNKTQGTSNKFYHAELQVALKGTKCQIYTEYGPTGTVQKREWRHYDSEEVARKDYEKILKSKRKKGYRDIDVAQRALGSDGAKSITKPVKFKNEEAATVPGTPHSKLKAGQKRLVEIFFGSQAQFVVETLKCPLGQLTNKQIDDGQTCLDSAKQIINAKPKLTKKDLEQLLQLTNDFYGLIPHNLGAGARGQMDHLLLDSLDKVMKKQDDLDTLLDAKQVGAKLTGDASLDDQYRALNADIDMLDHGDPIFKWIVDYFEQTKVGNHGYANSRVKNVWTLRRQDGEIKHFDENARRIAEQCGEHTFVRESSSLSRRKLDSLVPANRPDLGEKERKLFTDANVWLCWHGTRSANLVGITTRGLMIRPSGAVHTGSMFGDGKYFAWQSTKSLNYTDGGYWTGGRSHNDSRFMFLLDVAMGKMHIAGGPSFYKGPPKGHHSVYGKAHRSGVYNDEMITYDFNKKDTQSSIRYLLEISDR
jgi:poly [ADP-ribose] polymerase